MLISPSQIDSIVLEFLFYKLYCRGFDPTLCFTDHSASFGVKMVPIRSLHTEPKKSVTCRVYVLAKSWLSLLGDEIAYAATSLPATLMQWLPVGTLRDKTFSRMHQRKRVSTSVAGVEWTPRRGWGISTRFFKCALLHPVQKMSAFETSFLVNENNAERQSHSQEHWCATCSHAA